jgi:hypothetical protein
MGYAELFIKKELRKKDKCPRYENNQCLDARLKNEMRSIT